MALGDGDGKNGRFKITIKERRQFDNKIPVEFESELDNFDLDNSYPTLPFKGRNIVDLDFVCKQLLDGCKACKTTLSLTQGLGSILYLSCQNCSTVTMVKTNKWDSSENTQDAYSEMHASTMFILSVQQNRIRNSCDSITCESGYCSVVLLAKGFLFVFSELD